MPLNTKNQWHFLKKHRDLLKSYHFDAKNSLFTGAKHRNEIYIAFSMLKMPYFRVLSIGMKFTQYFRC